VDLSGAAKGARQTVRLKAYDEASVKADLSGAAKGAAGIRAFAKRRSHEEV